LRACEDSVIVVHQVRHSGSSEGALKLRAFAEIPIIVVLAQIGQERAEYARAHPEPAPAHVPALYAYSYAYDAAEPPPLTQTQFDRAMAYLRAHHTEL
jgi:hypothetical protein